MTEQPDAAYEWAVKVLRQDKRRKQTMELINWFLWGLCMGAGWTIAAWLLSKVLR